MESIVKAERGYTIYIGHEGDALGTVVEFDMSRYYDKTSADSYAVLVRRPREKESYPAAEVHSPCAGKVQWTVSAVDAALSGEGEVQVLYTNGTKVIHSEKFKTNIKTSLDGSATPPEEVIPYITAIKKAVATAENEANVATDAAQSALDSKQNAAESERNAKNSETNVFAKDKEIHTFVIRSKTEIAEETQGAVDLIERTTEQAIGDAKYEIGTEADTTKEDIRVFGGQIKEKLDISAAEAAESAKQAQQLAQSVRNDADAGKFTGERGPQGIQGPKGEPGSDANVTAMTIRNALGYLPISSSSLSPYAQKTYVDQAVSSIKLCVVVLQLPAVGEANKIYLVRRDQQEANNVFDEYLWIQSKWEYIGQFQAQIDLSEYAKKTDVGVESVKFTINSTASTTLQENGSVMLAHGALTSGIWLITQRIRVTPTVNNGLIYDGISSSSTSCSSWTDHNVNEAKSAKIYTFTQLIRTNGGEYYTWLKTTHQATVAVTNSTYNIAVAVRVADY